MQGKKMFDEAGIIVAVQDPDLLKLFESKTNMYDFLKTKGFPVPLYKRFRTKEEFNKVLKELGYPQKSFLIKPNSDRGGRGITILSERPIANKDNLALMDQNLFTHLIDGKKDFLIMEYIDGIVYDIDVLQYKNGQNYFGIRKRFTNVTKLFSGNIFENNNKSILDFTKKLYKALPTKYLIDYDFMVTEKGEISLLEINPRPSGSTISYLPFGVNLYYILAKSYLDNKNIEVPDSLDGNHAVTFYKMIEGKR